MDNYKQYLVKVNKGQKNLGAFIFDRITSLFIKSKRNKIENPKNILLIRNDHIGDMILSTNIFREIKEAFPEAKITVMADPANRVIIEKDRNVDEIIEFDLFWRRKNLKALFDYLKILRELKRRKFDVGIDLRGSKLNSFFFLFLPGIKNRIGYYNISGGKAFLTHPVLLEKKLMAYKMNIPLLIPLGIKPKNYLPHIASDKKDIEEVGSFIKKNKLRDFIILCPGSTTTAKMWPPEKFKEFIEKFSKRFPKTKILVSSGPRDKSLVNCLCEKNDNCIPLIGFNLRRLNLLLKKARFAIANDGGVREIVSVSGAKLIALCGPVDLGVHTPFKYFRLLHHKLPCYPCDWSKPCKTPCGKWCMDLITVEEVMKASEEAMKK